MQRPVGVLPGGLAGLGLPVHPAPATHDALDVLGRTRAPNRQQPLLRLRGGHAGDSAHLRVRQLATGERLREQWQPGQGARHPYVLAGRAWGESHAPGQPLGTGPESIVPSPSGIELANEIEEAGGRGFEVRRQHGDLVAESVEV